MSRVNDVYTRVRCGIQQVRYRRQRDSSLTPKVTKRAPLVSTGQASALLPGLALYITPLLFPPSGGSPLVSRRMPCSTQRVPVGSCFRNRSCSDRFRLSSQLSLNGCPPPFGGLRSFFPALRVFLGAPLLLRRRSSLPSLHSHLFILLLSLLLSADNSPALFCHEDRVICGVFPLILLCLHLHFIE